MKPNFVRATFDRESFRLKEAKFLTPCVREARFVRAAETGGAAEGCRKHTLTMTKKSVYLTAYCYLAVHI